MVVGRTRGVSQSVMNECPVCKADLEETFDTEQHISNCFKSIGISELRIPHTARYLG